jgi:hypothetical protein
MMSIEHLGWMNEVLATVLRRKLAAQTVKAENIKQGFVKHTVLVKVMTDNCPASSSCVSGCNRNVQECVVWACMCVEC